MSRMLALFGAVVRALYSGVWLGVLDEAHFPAVTAGYYATLDKYSNQSYNLGGLFEWEREAVESVFSEGSSVLVPSAGGGRELIALASMGHSVFGCDPAPHLVEHGCGLIADQGVEAELKLSPPNRIPGDLARKFDSVLVGWGAYSHINGRANRVAFLGELRARVAEGSPMIVSFVTRSSKGRSFRVSRVVGGTIRKLRGSREAVEPGDYVLPDYFHHFTFDEIESELTDGGFTVEAFSERPYPHAICRAV